jgi:hypothetical protein
MNNAPCHIFFSTVIFFTKNNMTVIFHPLYPLDLTSCSSSLFPQLMIPLF